MIDSVVALSIDTLTALGMALIAYLYANLASRLARSRNGRLLPPSFVLSLFLMAMVGACLAADLVGASWFVRAFPPATFAVALLLFCVQMVSRRSDFRPLTFCRTDVAAFFLWIALTSLMLYDVPGLPTAFDGVAATTYFRRMFLQGHVFAPNLVLSQASIFGRETFEYYPTGSHAMGLFLGAPFLLASFPAGHLLKAILVCACASVFAMVTSLLRRRLPRAGGPTSVFLVAILFCSTAFPLPFASRGMYPLVVSTALVLPLCLAGIAYQRGGRALVASSALSLPVSFFFHPAASVLLGIAVSLCLLETFRRSSCGWKGRAWCTASFGVGVVLTFLLLQRANVAAVQTVTDTLFGKFAWIDPLSHVGRVVRSLPQSHSPLGAVVVGLSFCVALFARGAPRARRAARYSLWSLVAVGMAIAASYSGNGFVKGLSLIFYNDPDRIAMLLFPPVCLAFVEGITVVASTRKFADFLSKWGLYVRLRQRAVVLLASVAALEIVSSFDVRRAGLFDAGLPLRWSEIRALVEWVRSATDDDTPLVKGPKDLDVLEGLTGREGLMVVNECPTDLAYESCPKKKEFWAETHRGIVPHLYRTLPPAEECAETLSRFQQPPVVILSYLTDDVRRGRPLARSPCLDLELAYDRVPFAIYRYLGRRKEHAP